ncbi:sugar transferase [Ruegeria sp. A3M17]|uniref:sugar transferase n=1 Tax=Ruegeria sp. A3M17 TaxID=2267229 RepID=UPI000DE91584|nr:sugar transferase [Ruegeria sp. A3M17]RBW54934.1 sugar transferase [Ruegeria sp. A3M17]
MNHIPDSFQLEESKIYSQNQTPSIKNDDNLGLKSVYAVKGKRLIDIVLVLIGAPFVLPLMLVIAFFVRLDGGPAIYRQKRVGIGGDEFEFLKFRSMVVHADEMMRRHLAENTSAVAEWETMQKLDNDPRITKFGRLIRATSLDELPQLWNVLIGDMSLVGPRPMLPEQQELYPGQDYILMKPGITGPWQVSERNDVEFAHRAIFDSEYARNIGFWFDLKILFRTIGVVCNRTGR